MIASSLLVKWLSWRNYLNEPNNDMRLTAHRAAADAESVVWHKPFLRLRKERGDAVHPPASSCVPSSQRVGLLASSLASRERGRTSRKAAFTCSSALADHNVNRHRHAWRTCSRHLMMVRCVVRVHMSIWEDEGERRRLARTATAVRDTQGCYVAGLQANHCWPGRGMRLLWSKRDGERPEWRMVFC